MPTKSFSLLGTKPRWQMLLVSCICMVFLDKGNVVAIHVLPGWPLGTKARCERTSVTNVCYSQPESTKASNISPESWIVSIGSCSCPTGLSSAQVAVPLLSLNASAKNSGK